MNQKKIILLIVLSCWLFITSCTKNVDVSIPDYRQQLVVEGSIEPGVKPYVMLSFSMPYFGENSTSNLQTYVVKGALVVVSDGLTTDTLKELFPGNGYFYMAQNMVGAEGRTYHLTIVVDGKIYTSTTTIHPPVALDSLYNKHEGNDSLGFVWARMTEPGAQVNHYRWFTKRIGKDADFTAPLGSAFDDKFINGKTFDFAYNRPIPQNSEAEEDKNIEAGYFKNGDQIIVKFCTIGEKEFRFLRSYDANMLSNGNPFAAPSNVETNIQGTDVIGLWCGYNPVYDTVVFQ